MIGEFIKARVVESDEGFLAMTSKIDEAAAEYANKGKKAELGLIYLKQNRKSKLIPVASALVSRGLRKAGAKEEARLNRYLMQDGYR